MITIDRLVATHFKRRSIITQLYFITSSTPDGEFHIIFDKQGVALASGFGTMSKLQERLPVTWQHAQLTEVQKHHYQQLVRSYYIGNRSALDTIPRHQEGSDFQKRVWRALSEIPYGQTISYKDLAEKIDNPQAVRAAGTACGMNRLTLLIPCHRVLKSDGTSGDYLYCSKIKESLLKREGVKLEKSGLGDSRHL